MKKAKLGRMMTSSKSVNLTTLLDKNTKFRHTFFDRPKLKRVVD